MKILMLAAFQVVFNNGMSLDVVEQPVVRDDSVCFKTAIDADETCAPIEVVHLEKTDPIQRDATFKIVNQVGSAPVVITEPLPIAAPPTVATAEQSPLVREWLSLHQERSLASRQLGVLLAQRRGVESELARALYNTQIAEQYALMSMLRERIDELRDRAARANVHLPQTFQPLRGRR